MHTQTIPRSSSDRQPSKRPLVFLLAGAAGIFLFTAICAVVIVAVALAGNGAEPADSRPETIQGGPSESESPEHPGSQGGASGLPAGPGGSQGNPAPQFQPAGQAFRVTEIASVYQQDCSCGSNFNWQAWSVGAELEFHADGSFVYVPVGIGTLRRNDLYPIRGTYRQQGNEFSFEGSWHSILGQGITAEAAITGRIWVDATGQPRVHMTHRADSITAAVINGQNMGQNLYSIVEYEATATVAG